MELSRSVCSRRDPLRVSRTQHNMGQATVGVSDEVLCDLCEIAHSIHNRSNRGFSP